MTTPPSQLLVRTGNVTSSAAGVVRKGLANSQRELVSALRENFKAAIGEATLSTKREVEDGNIVDPQTWTESVDGVLTVPAKSPYSGQLKEVREGYEVTVKLFFLPGVEQSRHEQHMKQALEQVLSELGTEYVDLLIVSFPDIHFDADDEDEPVVTSEEVPAFVGTYRVAEELQQNGSVRRLGVSEFGSSRLSSLLKHAKVKPGVDQINVRDCCVVPKPLILFAKEKGIDLLTHDDCAEILNEEILGGVLKEFGFEAGWRPEWVVKYTAVVRDRGVVENKGYFAFAQKGGEAAVEKNGNGNGCDGNGFVKLN
ncbi:Aldo/keto reductase [Ascobolus immersus RN42]|uniref:GCS light chain n=1 Tax=Ascobolus immersus RN42 TaxID=1160509 RepID=A0A3N4IRF0_ASCIM|nr:Aldo/keto reductase [Ascobolus immersus RN42]